MSIPVMYTYKRFGIKWINNGAGDSPLVIEAAIGYPQTSEEAPDIAVVPVDDWVDAIKTRPVGIGRVYEREFTCAVMRSLVCT